MTAQPQQSVFGCGYLWITGTSTPRLAALLQDISFSSSQDSKPLYGQGKDPLEIGQGKRKFDFKAAIGRFDPNVLNDLYFGGTITTGQSTAANLESGTIPAPSGPYTITVANSATWTTDLGVFDTVTGKFLTKDPSGTPPTGHYTVSAGVYTFAAADTGHALKISYVYTLTSGYNIATGNPQMGTGPTFRADLFNSYNGVASGITALRCAPTKMDFASKLDDWTLPGFEFTAMDDGTGQTLKIYGQGSY